VIDELVEWTDGGERLQLHAARSFLLIAGRTAPGGSGWPDLLRRLEAGDVDRNRVGLLWVLALSYPPTASRAWRELTLWLVRAGRDPVAAARLLDVVRMLAGTVPLRSRLDHQLRHVWHESWSSNPILGDIETIIREASS
jgi:hypothetical protein